MIMVGGWRRQIRFSSIMCSMVVISVFLLHHQCDVHAQQKMPSKTLSSTGTTTDSLEEEDPDTSLMDYHQAATLAGTWKRTLVSSTSSSRMVHNIGAGKALQLPLVGSTYQKGTLGRSPSSTSSSSSILDSRESKQTQRSSSLPDDRKKNQHHHHVYNPIKEHKMAHAVYDHESDSHSDDEDDDVDDTMETGFQGTSVLEEDIDQDVAYQNPDYYLGIEYQQHRAKHHDFVHSFAGMKLHVFGLKQQDLEDGNNDDDNGDDDDDDDDEKEMIGDAVGDSLLARSGNHRQQPKKHNEQLEQQSTQQHYQWENTYQLLEPMHMELGIPPKHYWDYAYTPVTNHQNPLNGVGGRGRDILASPIARSGGGFTSESVPHPSTGATNKEPLETCLAITKGTKGLESVKGTALEDKDSQSSFEDRDSWWKWWFSFGSPWWRSNQESEYTTRRSAFAGGSHGQVWRGRRVCDYRSSRYSRNSSTSGTSESMGDRDCDEDRPLILKRLKVEQGYRLLEAGLREVYFGQWIRDLTEESQKDLFTTYVDHFFRELPRFDGSKDLELWIVFEDAGPSLRSYIYAPVASAGGFVMYQHSPLWTQLRMTTSRTHGKKYTSKSENRDEPEGTIEIRSDVPHPSNETFTSDNSLSVQGVGREILRTVLKQIIHAASVLHEGGIVHRDIKPSNVMCISDEPLDDLFVLSRVPNIHCRLGDFSSGWNEYTNQNFYTKGPSPAEQTDEYAPPEANIDLKWKPFDDRSPQSYDSWSIGVLALELLLGTPNVFSVDQRTTVLLTSKMKKEGASDDDVQRALYLAALSQFCIYVPSSHDKEDHSSWPHRQGDPLYNTAMAKDTCTMQDFHRALRARDPLGMGFDSSTDLLLHLIWQLLAWDPVERITAAEALRHPFFLSPDGTREGLDIMPGRHNALESQMLDPRMDFVVNDNVHEFVCPKCGRTFTDWRSCNAHATSRRHAKFCSYARTHLPSCINTHSMLPAHPTSGYCDLQGRRPTIEDFHSIHLYPEIQFYGIFDGHTGNVASKYAASTLFDRLMLHLPELSRFTNHAPDGSDWKNQVEHNVSRAYKEIHESFLDALAFVPTMDQSGTTATALIVSKHIIVLSSLGDSRAVLSSTDERGRLSAIQLTIDHVASDPKERDLVLKRGGRVSSSLNGIARVNGTLAITRSIGDAALASMLSRQPHVTSMKRDEIQDLCGSTHKELPCFVILASDGLWDVMTNQEAVDMVAQVVSSYDAADHTSWNHGGAFQEAAEVLAVDAFVRGSTDNIGVCVVAIV